MFPSQWRKTVFFGRNFKTNSAILIFISVISLLVSILPNCKVLTGNAVVTVGIKNFPAQSDTTSTYSPFTITSSTEKIDTRARGRFANIQIANTGTSESWRFGTVRIDLQPDGRR